MNETIVPLPRALRPVRPASAPSALRAALRPLSRAAPELARRWATSTFLEPPRSRVPRRERAARAEALRDELSIPGGTVQTFRWSRGPFLPWENRGVAGRILLVHGWGGRGSQLFSFLDPLRAAGLEVLAFDAPGHGDSSSGAPDVAGLVDVIRALDQAHGPFSGAIGHSMGAGALLTAVNEGARIERVVAIGGPSRLQGVAERFARALDLGPEASRRFEAGLRKRFGDETLARFDITQRLVQRAVPALVLHDVDDRDVPFEEARLLADAWPGARLLPTAGLGHRRILRDPVVVEETASFLLEGRALPAPYTPNPFAAPARG